MNNVQKLSGQRSLAGFASQSATRVASWPHSSGRVARVLAMAAGPFSMLRQLLALRAPNIIDDRRRLVGGAFFVCMAATARLLNFFEFRLLRFCQ